MWCGHWLALGLRGKATGTSILRKAYATPSYEFVRTPLLASTAVLLQPLMRENPELQTVLDLLQR